MTPSGPLPPDIEQGSRSTAELDYLLAAGRLGGVQRDKILEAVVETVRSEKTRAPKLWRFYSKQKAIAAAGALAAVAAWVTLGPHPRDRRDPFQAKGSQHHDEVWIDATCLGGSLGACRRGSIMAFSVEGASPEMFITAWLESSKAGSIVPLLLNEPPPASNRVLPHGARISDDQPLGDYRVHVVVTRRPIAGQIVAAVPEHELVSRSDTTIRVTP